MDKKGVWRLSPAYDMTFSYNKSSTWVNAHQMLINGKADEITNDDFMKVAEFAGIKKAEAEKCIKQVKDAISKWNSFADEAGLSKTNAERISKFFNLDIQLYVIATNNERTKTGPLFDYKNAKQFSIFVYIKGMMEFCNNFSVVIGLDIILKF